MWKHSGGMKLKTALKAGPCLVQVTLKTSFIVFDVVAHFRTMNTMAVNGAEWWEWLFRVCSYDNGNNRSRRQNIYNTWMQATGPRGMESIVIAHGLPSIYWGNIPRKFLLYIYIEGCFQIKSNIIAKIHPHWRCPSCQPRC